MRSILLGTRDISKSITLPMDEHLNLTLCCFYFRKNGETVTYQLFIEPKGEYLKERDEWKEVFLKTIQERGITHILLDDHKYRILAVGQFYSEQVRDQFKEQLTSILQLEIENEDI